MKNFQLSTLGGVKNFPASRYTFSQKFLCSSLSLSVGGSVGCLGALANVQPVVTHVALPTATHSWQTGGSAQLTSVQLHPVLNASSAYTNAANVSGSVAHAAGQVSRAVLGSTSLQVTHGLSTSTSGSGDLNLGSPVAMFAASSLAGFHSVTLDIGGKKETIDFGSKLTGAELVAAEQLLAGGKQQIIIANNGTASGGRFSLSAASLQEIDSGLGSNLTTLDISSGVKVVDSLATLNLSGSLINMGTIYMGAPTGVKGQSGDTISAASILNRSDALISSVSRQSGVVATGINLDSFGSFINNGAIASSHDVNIAAVSITNAQANSQGSGSSTQPSLTAAGNVNLSTPALTNSGLISATSGNVNVANVTGNKALNINGAGGTIEAGKGNINLNNASANESANINITGGNLLSQQVNFNGGTGIINASLDQVSGVVNGTASGSHITAATANLQLGTLNVSGDPTDCNTAGNITIDSGIKAANGEPLAIVASGNIIGNGGVLDTSTTSGSGGALTLIAGASFSLSPNTASPSSNGPDTGTTLTVTGGTGAGGYIDLSGVTLTGVKSNTAATINTSSTDGIGGNVLMVAYGGTVTNTGSIVATPTIAQNKTASSINTSGSTGYGDLTIIGGGSSIQMQNVSLGSATSGGTINVLATNPTITNGPLTILSGAITAGSYSTTSTPNVANISFGNINAAAINLSTAGALLPTKSTVLTAADTTLTAGSAGTSAAPLLTNTSTLLTINGNSKSSIFVSEQNSGTVSLAGSSSAPGQAITLTSVASTLNVNNLDYTNVTITDNGYKKTAGNIVINPLAIAGSQVGEIYSTSQTSTNALGTGTIKISASGNITDNDQSAPNIAGQTVVLTSSGGSIGLFDGNNSVPVTISGANLTANAVKGSVFVNDLVQTTLNAGSSGSAPSQEYSVTGNGLVVAGAINGGNIALAAGVGTVAGGPGTILDINANIGSTKTQSVYLSGDNGITQTLPKAVVTGVSVILDDAATGTIGSAVQSILTKATGELQVHGYGSGNTGTTAYVSQSGSTTLGASSNNTLLAGTLNLAVSGTLTVVGAVNYGNVIITAPTVLVAQGGSVAAFDAAFQSSGALLISGISATNTGTISASDILALSGLNGAAATSITIGAKDGSANPLVASLLSGSTTSVNNLTINSKGNFVSPLSELALNSTSPGELKITAANLVTSGTSLSAPLVLSASSTGVPGTVDLNITGSQTVTLTGTSTVPGTLEVTALGTSNGAIYVTTKGALNIDPNGLGTIAGSGGTNLVLNASKVTVGADSPTALSADYVTVVTPSLIVNGLSSSLTGADSSTFTAKGAMIISGSGSIIAGSSLNLGSTTVSAEGSTSYITSSITLGLKDGSSNPLASQLGSYSYSFDSNTSTYVVGTDTGVLSNLTISTTGNFTSGTSALVLNPASPGALNITAANLVSSTPLTTPYFISSNSSGSGAAGSVNIDLTGAAVTFGINTGNFQVSAVSANNVGGASVSITTKGNLTAMYQCVNIDPNSSVSFSTSGAFLQTENFIPALNSNGTGITGTTLTVTGAKSVVFTDPVLVNVPTRDVGANSANFVSITINDGSTAPFTIGQIGSTTKNPTNGSLYSIGEQTNETSSLTNLTLNTGGGITFMDSGYINMALVSTLTLASKGAETILGGAGVINPGSTLYISGKSITLGTPNPQGNKNPLSSLSSSTTSNVNQLAIVTSGTFTMATNGIYVDVGPNAGNFPAASTNSIKADLAVSSNFDPEGFGGGYLYMVLAGMAVNYGDSPNYQLLACLAFGGGLNGGAVGVKSNGIFASPSVSSGATALVVDYTGSKPLTLGQNTNATSATLNLQNGGAAGSITTFQGGGVTTVGDSSGSGVTLSNSGTLSLTSAGNMTINRGGISLGSTTALTLASGKNLAVLDSGLLNGTVGTLSSVSLTSASTAPFVVGASGTSFANGTAGSVVAPSVTILANTLQNNGLIAGGGSGTGSTLTLGSVSSAGFTVLSGTGSFGSGASNGFDYLTVSSSGNVNLTGILAGSASALPASSLSSISITTPGTVTFNSLATSLMVGPAALGLANAGDGGTISISAKSIVAANGFEFDASTVTDANSNTAGIVSLTTAAPIIIGTTKGAFTVNVGGTAGGGTVDLVSTGGAVTLNSALNTGSGSLTGTSVVVNSSLQAGTSLDITANLKTTGTISTTSTGSITAPLLALSQTSVKLASTALSTASAALELALGAFNINNVSGASNTLVGSLSGSPITALTLVNKGLSGGATTIGSISTTAGSISITDNTPSGTLSVTSFSSLVTNNGSIFIDEKNGSISLGDFVSMHASGTAPGVGQISLITGQIPVGAVSIAGLTPQNASTTPTMVQTAGGSVFYGVSGDTGGTITVSGSGVYFNALGRNVVFYEGSGSITLAGSDTITADPPTGANVSASIPAAASSSAVANTSVSSVVSNSTFAGAYVSSAAIPPAIQSLQLVSGITAQPLQLAANQALSGYLLSTSKSSASLSSSKVEDGALPEGATLISSDTAKKLETKFGAINIAPKAVALVMNFEDGIAVYNLHDTAKGAVVIASGGHTFAIAPGQSVLLTKRSVRYFEEINPAQFVSYRKMVAREHGDMRSFQSEFNIASLLAGVGPLKALTRSGEQQNRRVVNSVLKTAAILNSFGGSEPFVPMRLPEMTAMAAH